MFHESRANGAEEKLKSIFLFQLAHFLMMTGLSMCGFFQITATAFMQNTKK
jgi:hypothetical protein